MSTLTFPHDIQNGDLPDADELMANLEAVKTLLETTKLDNDNLKAAAAIALSKLAAVSGGQIPVGNASGVLTARTLSGALVVTDTGVVALLPGAVGTSGTLADTIVTNAKLDLSATSDTLGSDEVNSPFVAPSSEDLNPGLQVALTANKKYLVTCRISVDFDTAGGGYLDCSLVSTSGTVYGTGRIGRESGAGTATITEYVTAAGGGTTVTGRVAWNSTPIDHTVLATQTKITAIQIG